MHRFEHLTCPVGLADRAATPPVRRLPRRLLSVWAHPGDESEWSAGLLARTVRAGGHVTVVALTDGEHAFGADDDRSPRRRRRRRRTELYAATRRLGVHDVRFLGVPVGGVASSSRPVVRALTHLIEDICPDLVLTAEPGAHHRHPDHVAAAELVTRSWLERRSGDLWYATEQLGGAAGVGVELDGTELDRKLDAVAAHRGRSSGPARADAEWYRPWSIDSGATDGRAGPAVAAARSTPELVAAVA